MQHNKSGWHAHSSWEQTHTMQKVKAGNTPTEDKQKKGPKEVSIRPKSGLCPLICKDSVSS